MKKNIPHILRSGGVGFPKVSSGLLLRGLNAGSEMLWTKFGFLILNSRFLILVLVCICVFVGGGAAADTVNYDTAWTFVYDGGKQTDGTPMNDVFHDSKALKDGGHICVGSTIDATGWRNLMLMKLDAIGNMKWKKLFRAAAGHSIAIATNGDFIIGGSRGMGPWVLRTDTLGNIKWTNWVYDSLKNQPKFLSRSATINCVRETSLGSIICVAGDEYPNNGGQPLKNYAAYLEFNTLGKLTTGNEWNGITGYNLGGFDIEETGIGQYVLSGNQGVLYTDTAGHVIWEKAYTFMLEGVGLVTNNVSRCKMLRDGTLMVAGQAYEGNCWNRYKQLYYDAWWTPISYAYGAPATRDTAGRAGGDEKLLDFTQLVTGKLAFVGIKDGGVWTWVTDSTGKQILWEKQTLIRYRTDNGNDVTPLSINPSPDSGFTVVGQDICNDSNGAINAFAVHYIPKAPTAIKGSAEKRVMPYMVQSRVVGSKVIFALTAATILPNYLTIYNASGRVVANLVTTTPLTWDCSHAGRGVYFYRIENTDGTYNGKVVVEK
jgi:hypothetical protein